MVIIKPNATGWGKTGATKLKCRMESLTQLMHSSCRKTYKTENCWNGANVANEPGKRGHEFAIPRSQIGEQPIPTIEIQPRN